MEEKGQSDMNGWSRRKVLAGLTAIVPATAMATPIDRSLRPNLRPEDWPPPQRPVSRPDLADYVQRYAPSGQHTLSVVDLRSGQTIEAMSATTQLPPASVTKAVTAFYALAVLGSEFAFETRLIADGSITDGILDGDLILQGSGDPNLKTDDLATLAKAVRRAGIRQVSGRLLLASDALPHVFEIEPAQKDHLSYNPSLSGLNLNYNRVYFSWRRAGSGHELNMNAATRNYNPAVSVATIESTDRDLPVYQYAGSTDSDHWTVARGALGAEGARWLPVRYPALYCGDVLKTLLNAEGVRIGSIDRTTAPATGQEIARHTGEPLTEVARKCLRFSTNLTAEAMGLTASAQIGDRPANLVQSAQRMEGFVQSYAPSGMSFYDHSGLSDRNRVSPSELTDFLARSDVARTIGPILKEHTLVDENGDPINAAQPVRAKTGTLDFVSTLAGYFTTRSGRQCAFAIQSADLDRRDIAKLSPDDVPEGTRPWARDARRLQQKLLQRWVLS